MLPLKFLGREGSAILKRHLQGCQSKFVHFCCGPEPEAFLRGPSNGAGGRRNSQPVLDGPNLVIAGRALQQLPHEILTPDSTFRCVTFSGGPPK